MAQVIYTHCRHCGHLLDERSAPYCPPCNLYLAYRAIPMLLGMLLTGQRAPAPAAITPDLSSRPRKELANVFPCRIPLCGVSPCVTALCDCTASEG